MQEKDMYTLRELYDNLEVPYSKLGKMADMSEGTVTRIRDGYPARRTTINRLLKAFSMVYSRPLTIENVGGIQLEDKHPAKSAEKSVTPATSIPPIEATIPIADSQIRNVEPQKSKRGYKKTKDTSLPAGCISALDFARNHGRADRTFRDDMLIGLGEGTIWGKEGHPALPVKDHVDFSEREKPGRSREKERYLTDDQQHAAFLFWQKHGVEFHACDVTDCWCHIRLEE
jgi:hypothetical protein